jgi:hypothetical protein
MFCEADAAANWQRLCDQLLQQDELAAGVTAGSLSCVLTIGVEVNRVIASSRRWGVVSV